MSSHLVPVYPPTTYAVLPIVAAALSELAAGREPAGYVRPVAISTPVMRVELADPVAAPEDEDPPTDPRRRRVVQRQGETAEGVARSTPDDQRLVQREIGRAEASQKRNPASGE